MLLNKHNNIHTLVLNRKSMGPSPEAVRNTIIQTQIISSYKNKTSGNGDAMYHPLKAK